MINIIEVTGYDDGYYWDYRVYFEYDGNPYTYLCWGSGSGYMPNYMGIRKGGEKLPEDSWEHEVYRDKPEVNKSQLKKAAKLLLESGEDEFEIEEDEAGKYGWEWW